MRRTPQISAKNTSQVLSASEIGQYTYCSLSWYLQRLGYRPESPALEKGKTLHKELGKTIDRIQRETRKATRYALLGVVLLIIAGLIVLFVEVII